MEKVYSVRDAKAEAFERPWVARTRGEAIRSFSEACNDKQHPYGKYPEDFGLFEIGEFDSESGKLIPALQGVNVIEGIQCLKRVDSGSPEIQDLRKVN